MVEGGMFQTPAEAYDRFVGRYGSALAAQLIDFAGAEPGMRALDVGCGPGALTDALSSVLGADGTTAVDPSEQFAAACRERNPGVEVAVAGAESLPFEDDRFDLVMSQLVVNFMADPEAGVREMARVARPGGTVASCVWDYAGEMTLLRVFWEAAEEIAPEHAAGVDERTKMRWCGEGELAVLWERCGLADARSEALVVSATYSGFEDLWSPFPTGVGPAGAFCKSLGDQDRAALELAYRERLGQGDEPFTLTARAWAVAASVAG